MSTTKPKPTIKIRGATLLDHREMGRTASETYYDTDLTRFLSPHAGAYYSHYARGFTQRILKRMLDPRSLSFVACVAGSKEPIAYIQLARLGDDAGAQAQIASRTSVWLWVLGWMFVVWCKAVDVVVGGDKSADPEALRLFEGCGTRDEEKYWKPFPDRMNRWYVQSCVVRSEYQGMGVGKMMIREVTKRAQEEGVVIGLEASSEGYWLYKSVGFELLGRFDTSVPDAAEDGGGIMMWSPRGGRKRSNDGELSRTESRHE
jgi:GNAT superfamily N-acetyltransferase